MRTLHFVGRAPVFVGLTVLLVWSACMEPAAPIVGPPSVTESAGDRDLSPIDLGTLGGTFSLAFGINDRDQVVGTSSLDPSGTLGPFLWQGGTMINLGTLGADFGVALAINAHEQVVGHSWVTEGQSHAFLWENGTLTDLGTLGGATSLAHGINDDGVVVGVSALENGESHAFQWKAGGMTDLGTLGGTFSQALAISERNEIVGVSTLANDETRPFLWKDGTMSDLGTLGGTFGAAWAINNLGQIVGEASRADGEIHAFLWENGVMSDLGTLGGTFSRAQGVDNQGQVVGFSRRADGRLRAFLWKAGSMSDLGTLGGPTGTARWINDLGHVAGWSSLATGETRATLWTSGTRQSSAVPAHLTFTTQPGGALSGTSFDTQPVVEVLDAEGSRVEGRAVHVTLTLTANPAGGRLLGTTSVTTSTGLAAFTDLSIDKAGSNYTLTAIASGITTTSAPFDVEIRFAHISVSTFMGCGMSTGGDGYCWGRNQTGGLGIGSAGTNRSHPTLLAGGLTFVFVDVGAGSNINGFWDGFGCGITADGTTYCWGRNDFGQLGNGNTGTDSDVPVPVSGGHAFVALSAGRDHACALTASGDAYCWGDNRTGRLGIGSMTPSSSNVPLQVIGGLTWIALNAGTVDTCGITINQDAYCWGNAGPTKMPGPSVSVPTALPGGLRFKQVSTGSVAHGCGATVDNDGYCWGQNSFGELGNSSDTEDSATPVLVGGGLKFSGVQAGSQYSCGLTLDGDVYCWGRDANEGSLGQGSVVTSPVPLKVVGGHKFGLLSVGNNQSCAVTPGGVAYCWGNGLLGERADGTFDLQAFSPVRVKAP